MHTLSKSKPPKHPDTNVYVEKLPSELILAWLGSYNGYKLLFDTSSTDLIIYQYKWKIRTSDNLPTSIKKMEELVEYLEQFGWDKRGIPNFLGIWQD